MKNKEYLRKFFRTKCGEHHKKCYGVYIIWCGHGACDKEDGILYIGMSGTLDKNQPDGNKYEKQDVIKRIINTKNGSAIEWCEKKLKPNCDKNLYIEVLCLDTTKKRQSIITPECAEAHLLESYERSYGELPRLNSQSASVKKKC